MASGPTAPTLVTGPRTLGGGFQPPVANSRRLAALDGVSVTTSAKYTVCTAGQRQKVVVKFCSLLNVSSAGTSTVSFYITTSSGMSPEIRRVDMVTGQSLSLLSDNEELVLESGDSLEVMAATNALTADIYASGVEEFLPG